MNRDRWLLLISMVIFASVGVYYWRSGIVLRALKKSAGAPIQPLPTAEAKTEAKIEAAGQERDPKIISGTLGNEGEWGRNPFLTPEEANRKEKPKESGIKIKAIVMGSPRSVATLDGQTVTVGEKVGEETVVAIHSNAVILEKDGRRRVLKIEEPAISIEVKEKQR